MARSRTAFDTAAGPLPFYSSLQGNWGELKFGVTAALWRQASVYANVNYQNDTNGGRRSFGGNVGVRIHW
jgi:outer membrane autotransporter protein